MRGTRIIVSSDPAGRMTEGIVAAGETHYPGQCVQVDPTVALVSGRHTYKIYDRTNDGDRPAGAFWVCTDELMRMEGKAITNATTFDSYGAGTHASYYAPAAGDEVNLLFKNVAGTADDVALGNVMIVDDATGKVIVTTGSPQTEVAVALEAITDPTADTLLWCQWSGH